MYLIALALLALAQPAADPIVGQVVDAAGDPVAGVEVMLATGLSPSGEQTLIGWPVWLSIDRAPVSERHHVLNRCRTDAEGMFRVDLPPEVVRSQEPLPVALWASRPGGRYAFLRLPWAIPAPAVPVRLVLGPAAASSFLVLGPDGAPDARARLAVTVVDRLGVPEEIVEKFAVAVDENGAAVVSAFAPGEIREVQVESPRFGLQLVRIDGSEAARPRTVNLEPAGRVSGHVRADGGKPVAGLRVRARTLTQGIDLGGTVGLAEAVTDGEGRFEIPAIAAGRLMMTLEFQSIPDLPYRGKPPANQVVEAGRTTTVEVDLKRAVRLLGTIRERGTGAPIAGVRPVTPDPSTRHDDPSAMTDAEGRFSGCMEGEQPYAFLYGLPKPYFVPANAPENFHRISPGATEFTLPPIELVRGVGLRGAVVDETAQPVAGALVRASWDGKGTVLQSVAARTDARGEFFLEGLDPMADLRVTAQAPDACTLKPETMRAGSEKPVILHVSRANAVVLGGRVVDIEGNPVEGAEVRISSRTRKSSGQVWRVDPVASPSSGNDALRSDARGRFRAAVVVPRNGEYQAAVRARGRLPGRTVWLNSGSGETAAFADVALRRIKTIEGVVRDRQGKPVAAAIVLQSGDGPIRTRAASDDQGRFRLPGVIEGKAIVFAQKDGFRFHGQPIDTEAGSVELVLLRTKEPPAAVLKTLGSVLPREEELALARRLLAPYLEKALARGVDGETFRAFAQLAAVDAGRAMELIEKGVISDQSLKDFVRSTIALGLARESPDEAAIIAESIQDLGQRCYGLLGIFDKLPRSERTRKVALLAQAHLQARSVKDPGAKLGVFGGIARSWIDLGETRRAEDLLKEGRALAQEVTPPGYERARFAEALARVDLPAALALIETAREDARRGDRVNRQFIFDRSHGEIAYWLADRSQAEAEQVLGLIADPVRRDGYVVAACARMAPRDLPRARRLADSIDDPFLQDYALGLIARSLAPADRSAAVRQLEEVFARLDAHRDDQVGHSSASSVAGVLLTTVEQIDPTRLQEFVWRAVSLRGPRGDVPNQRAAAYLAMNLARYDRSAAADVLETAVAEFGPLDTDPGLPSSVAEAEVLIDPLRAVTLVEGLPDDPSLARILPKNGARLAVAGMLSEDADARWQKAREYGAAMWRPAGSEF